MDPRTPRPWTVLAALLVVVLLAAHAPIVAGGQTWADERTITEVVPARLAALDAIADGRLPGWWDRAGLGAPLWAEPAHGAAYPGWWPAAIAPAHAPWLIDVLGVVHALWAALGVALLARRLGADDLGALVAGAVFAVSDVSTAGLVGGTIGAIAHLPWAALAGDIIARASSRRGRVVGAAALAAALAGSLLAGRFTVAADGAVLAFAMIAARAPRRGPAAAWGAGAVVLGLGLAAILVVPAILHLVGDVASSSGARPRGTAWAALELAMPGARSLGHGGPAPGAFVGGAAVLLAIAAVVRAGGGRRTLAGMAGVLVAMGCGGLPPWDALVGLDRAAAHPGDHLAAAAVLIAALAGVGFTQLAAGRPDRRTLRAVGIGGATLVVAIAALGAARPVLARALADRGGGLDAAVLRVDHVLGHGAVAVAVALVAIGLLLAASRRPWPWAVPAAGVLVLGHAVVVGRLTHQHTPRAALAEPPSLIAAAERGQDEDLAALVAAGLPPRVYRPEVMAGMIDGAREPALERQQTLEGAVASRFGLAAARWPAPGRQRAEDALWSASATAGGRMFDRFAIELAIVPSTIALPAGLPVLGERGSWAIVSTEARRPRVFLAPRWRWYPDDAAIAAALFPGPDQPGLPLGTVARLGDGSPPPETAAAAPAPCDVRAETPERVVVHCDGAGGVIVLLEAWAPGWEVTVDGAPARLERVDAAARGVSVGPGAHVAVFSYAAPGATTGRWISALSALLLAIALLGSLRSELRSRP